MRANRLLFGAAAAACLLLLAYGYYLQYFQDQDPCPLCLVQRGFYYGVLVLCAIGAFHPRFYYGILSSLFALGGIATAGRQVWLQHLPADKVPQCGPDLFFMLDNFPLSRTLQKLIEGTGECAVVDWTFLGLSIAEWSLGWFVALALYSGWLAVSNWRRRTGRT